MQVLSVGRKSPMVKPIFTHVSTSHTIRKGKNPRNVPKQQTKGDQAQVLAQQTKSPQFQKSLGTLRFNTLENDPQMAAQRPIFSAGGVGIGALSGDTMSPKSDVRGPLAHEGVGAAGSVQGHFENPNYIQSENESIMQRSALSPTSQYPLGMRKGYSTRRPTVGGLPTSNLQNSLTDTSTYKTCKSQRQKYRQRARENDSQSKNTDMINRFDKFCSLIGQGPDSASLKMKFAK